MDTFLYYDAFKCTGAELITTSGQFEMRIEKLSDITTEIISGFSHSRAKDLGKGTIVKSISIKDIKSEALELYGDDLGEDLDIGDKSFIEKFSLKSNEIVITAKGTSIRASVFKKSTYKILPTSNLLIIKCDEYVVRPEYLTIFLNLESTTREIRSKLAGTTIMSLSSKELGAISITVPSMDIQNKIINLYLEGQQFCIARENEIKNMKLLMGNSIYQVLNREKA